MTVLDQVLDVVGGQAELARAIGAKSQDIWNWARGGRPVPRDRCPAIERATGGKVVCEELRTDIAWVRVPDPDWPHPEGRPCIDIAGPLRPREPAKDAA